MIDINVNLKSELTDIAINASEHEIRILINELREQAKQKKFEYTCDLAPAIVRYLTNCGLKVVRNMPGHSYTISW